MLISKFQFSRAGVPCIFYWNQVYFIASWFLTFDLLSLHLVPKKKTQVLQ